MDREFIVGSLYEIAHSQKARLVVTMNYMSLRKRTGKWIVNQEEI